MYIIMIMVVELFGGSCEIQKISVGQWACSKDFMIACKTFWVRAIKIWAYFYKKYTFGEFLKLK